MGGRSLSLFVAASALVVAACGERPDNTPTAPEFAGGSNTGGCSFTTVSSLVKNEFGANSAQSSLATNMKNAGAKTNNATYIGYQILDAIADKYAAPGAPAPTNAAQTTVALLQCMNVGIANADIPSATTFEAALSSSGAYGVRGLTTTADTRALYSKSEAWLIEPPAANNWQAITTANDTITVDSLEDALLVYGYPISSSGFTNDTLTSSVFQWSTLPAATFNPGVIVGECSVDANYLQHNATSSSPEVLAFINPGCTSGGPFSLAAPRSLAERIVRFFEPTPLAAATLVTGTGGSKTNLSPFGVVKPGQTVLVPDGGWKWTKSGNTVNSYFQPSVIYDMKSAAKTPFLQPYVLVWLEATNNQGSKVLVCNNWIYTDANGVADLSKAYLNKAGGYTVTTKIAGALTLNIPLLGVVTVPTVPPSAPLNSPLINVKNDTSKQPPDNFGCPSFNGDTSSPPDYPGPHAQ